MTSLTFCASIIGLFAILNVASILAEANEEHGVLDCMYEANSLACVKKIADTELDRIEVEVTGKQSSVTFSKVLEETGEFMVDGARSILGLNDETEEGGIEGGEDNSEEEGNGERQARKKHGKKKKELMKMVPLMMLAKAKMGLMLQMVSTHFQMKFFVIALVSLMINVARFWVDVKTNQKPSKVIYYEQAHHQHHYDHEDTHGGYWGRSGEASPDELAYNGYASDH